MSDRLKIELWESPGEYVVTLDGKPIGQTVNQREGNQLIGWLNTTGMVAEIDRLRQQSTERWSTIQGLEADNETLRANQGTLHEKIRVLTAENKRLRANLNPPETDEKA